MMTMGDPNCINTIPMTNCSGMSMFVLVPFETYRNRETLFNSEQANTSEADKIYPIIERL